MDDTDRLTPGGSPRGPDQRCRTRQFAAVTVLASLLALGAVRAHAEVPILPLDEVRPGMRGTGRTVFLGDSISTFGVEILDVMRGARPRGSLILFRGQGSTLEHTGIIAGMSGSPVYVDGRLLGAVAFAYPMLKDPIGAITPIEEMLDLREHPDAPLEESEGMEAGPLVSASRGAGRGDDDRHGEKRIIESPGEFGAGSGSFPALWSSFLYRGDSRSNAVDSNPLFAPELGPTGTPSERASGLQPMAVPVSLAGWEPAAAAGLSRALSGAGFLPYSAAASANATGGASAVNGRRLEPGSAVAVSLIQGDASLAAVGTVTWVDGDRVLAFGHPMVQGGPVSFPMHAARIHALMPSLDVSFKMGSATAPLGGVYQDRRAGIYGTMGPIPNMIPVSVTVRLPGEPARRYDYRVVRDRILTGFLLPWTVSNSWLHAGWTQGDAVARCDVTVRYNHGEVVRRAERVRADAPPLQFAGAAVLPASLLLVNPYERATLDSLVVDLSVERRNPQAYVVGLRANRSRVRAGEDLQLTVAFEPWRAPREERTFTVRIRPEWAGRRLQLIAGSAAMMMEWDRDRAPGKYAPRSLTQLVRLIETIPDDGALVLRVLAPETGNLVDGAEVASLPPSIAAPGTGTGGRAIIRGAAGSLLEERVETMPWVLSGRETLEVEVEP